MRMRGQSLDFMQANFGKAGAYYYWISRAIDNREVRTARKRDFGAGTVTLKVKFNDFEIITRSRSVSVAVSSSGYLEHISTALLQNEMHVPVVNQIRTY